MNIYIYISKYKYIKINIHHIYIYIYISGQTAIDGGVCKSLKLCSVKVQIAWKVTEMRISWHVLNFLCFLNLCALSRTLGQMQGSISIN